MEKQEKKLDFLLVELIKEIYPNKEIELPKNIEDKKKLYRSLVNIRLPKNIDEKFLKVQNEYLQEENKIRGIVDINDLKEIQKDIYLWKGDITTLKVDGIVNAANSKLLGCFIPGHHCIDNAIHTFSGVQLRNKCDEIMKTQGSDEETGKAKITLGYNLPCKYILHTVGPIIYNELTEFQCKQLESCYKSCLELALENKLESIAFCCISTGEFHFPNDIAAKIAVKTIKKFKEKNNTNIKIIFNVFKDIDYNIYKELLQ